MNIFARELALILRSHGKELGTLFGLRVPNAYTGVVREIAPTKVTRLKRSLSENITATLNADELEALQEWVPLDDNGQELRRLRAALVAEAVRHLLADRIDSSTASELGLITFQMLLGQESAELVTLRDRLLTDVRGERGSDAWEHHTVRGASNTPDLGEGVGPTVTPDELVERLLDPAAECYEQGLLWLEVARDIGEHAAQAAYVALATSLLTQAEQLVRTVASAARDTLQQRLLSEAISAALDEAQTL